ncbi:hypothetical protein FOZ60_012823 [Perkinsus olseni]|nr:hypothetical protein FOZ60_012823 [Perkinsus olseni]
MILLFRTVFISTALVKALEAAELGAPDTDAELVKDDLPERKVDEPGDILETSNEKPKSTKTEKMEDLSDDLPEMEAKGADFSAMTGPAPKPVKPKKREPRFKIRAYKIDTKKVTASFRKPTCSGAVPVKAEASKVLSDPGPAFEELNAEASGKTDQSPEAAKAEKELDENPAMKEAKKIAENPVEEDAVVNQIEASGVSTPEPAEPVPTEAPEEEAADKKPPEPVKIDVNRESGGEIYSAALDHAVKAKMDIKPRDKFDMEAHRQKLVKRVEDIREGHQKEHAKQVEEAAKSDDNSVDSQSFIEQADCPGGNCPEEAAAPTAGGDEEAVGEENKEPPCEEGYDSSSRKKYKPCPYKPVWDDPTADKIKIERALKG